MSWKRDGAVSASRRILAGRAADSNAPVPVSEPVELGGRALKNLEITAPSPSRLGRMAAIFKGVELYRDGNFVV